MTDETGGQQSRPSGGPDPSFIKRLEDDSLWPEDGRSPMERRVERHARGRPRQRSRVVAIVVLVVAAALVAVIGLQIRDANSLGGSGPTTPFSVLPLQNNATTTTLLETTSTTTLPESTSTTIPLTTTTSGAASGAAGTGRVAALTP